MTILVRVEIDTTFSVETETTFAESNLAMFIKHLKNATILIQ